MHTETAQASPLTRSRDQPAPRLRFDRGTLVFVEPPNEQLLADHSEISFDPRTGSYRAAPWRYPAVAAQVRRGELPFVDEVACFDHVDGSNFQDVSLRPYQRAALCAWEAADRRGVLALPTGSGKTRIAIAAMAAAACSTLCMVPTRVLLHQWRGELERFYRGPVGLWGDGERQLEAVTVITFESAYRNMARLGNRFKLLVVDEVHHFGSAVRDEALEMAIAPHRLGLTATLPTELGALGEIGRLVGPTVFRSSVGELAGRYLADFVLVVLHLPLDPDERAEYDAARAVFTALYAAFRRMSPLSPWKDFVAVANQSHEGRTALAAWRRARAITALSRAKATTIDTLLAQHRDSRVLVFTPNNAVAYAIARRNLVMPLTCDIKRKEREQALARFRDGELAVLVSSRVLNEGIDVPDADVAIIVGGSQGTREYVQRVGRLLRPRDGKRATIYELIADDTTEARDAERKRVGLRR